MTSLNTGPYKSLATDLDSLIGGEQAVVDPSDCEKTRQRGSSACGTKPVSPDPDTPPKKDELLSITCSCGFGYFMADGTWISGVDVRAGRAPPRPGMIVPGPDEMDT